MMLDRGQREDWFSSAFIIRLAIVAVVALILFIIVERKSAEPVVNLRIFKNVSFASGNIIQFSAFFVLFGSIILLPLYVQQLMGYNALLAGLVLAPGGIATLISMPIAGRLVTRVNPKGILITGLLITAYSTFMMTRFNLYSDFNMICWSRIVMGLGMGFVFIPLMTMTLSSVKKEEMGNATGVFNLLRNLGGSFGVAFVATLLARRAQLHQLRFSEHLNIFDPRYQFYSAHAGNAVIYQRLLRESNMAAFTDTFYMSTIILLCILPLVFFLKRAKSTDAPVAAH